MHMIPRDSSQQWTGDVSRQIYEEQLVRDGSGGHWHMVHEEEGTLVTRKQGLSQHNRYSLRPF